MLESITILLLFQLAGETLSMLLRLPVPGPVIGMGLLFAALVVRGSVPHALSRTAHTLLQHLALLFVPAGVGVMLHFRRIADEWLPIVIALVASTMAAILVASTVLRAFRTDRDSP